MALSYDEFKKIHYQGREYYIIFVDPQNLYYGGEETDSYGNLISGEFSTKKSAKSYDLFFICNLKYTPFIREIDHPSLLMTSSNSSL